MGGGGTGRVGTDSWGLTYPRFNIMTNSWVCEWGSGSDGAIWEGYWYGGGGASSGGVAVEVEAMVEVEGGVVLEGCVMEE